MFSDPHGGWIIVAIVLTVGAAFDGETVPIPAGVMTTVLLFGLWRLGLAAWDSLSRRR
jgi:hypothetical protein